MHIINYMEIDKIRHSLAHLLAIAVLDSFPKAKLGIGPATDTGFYYDFDDIDISESDLKKLEKKMKELIRQDLKFERSETTKEKAKKLFKNQPFKLELIKDIAEKKVGLEKTGDFVDLCRGGHVKSTGEIPFDAFCLDRIAGAYWKGDEKNKMLVRIYGLAFKNGQELADYKILAAEAAKRDHRKIGKKLDLFHFSELVGPGLPLFTPKGTILKEILQKNIESICAEYGFAKVWTPHIAKIKLYQTSGHAQKFAEELFKVASGHGHEFTLKPVQCPHHTQLYASHPRSYRELPIRYMESEKQYRAEKAGEIGGLNRVYAITVEDGHTFCTADQIKDEIKGLIKIIEKFYKQLGLYKDIRVSLSFKDPKTPEKYIGSEKDWELAQKILKEISKELKLDAKIEEGEAALYGPKIDFVFKDSLGKEIQIPTVQLDFATPQRFNLTYTDKDGHEQTPIMIHRAILGSYERFIALLLEHFAGSLPLWLSPVQVMVVPVSQKHNPYAKSVAKKLSQAGLRVELADKNDTVGKKIRVGEIQRIPYLLIVGDTEKKNKSVNVRQRDKAKTKEIKTDAFIAEIVKKTDKKHG